MWGDQGRLGASSAPVSWGFVAAAAVGAVGGAALLVRAALDRSRGLEWSRRARGPRDRGTEARAGLRRGLCFLLQGASIGAKEEILGLSLQELTQRLQDNQLLPSDVLQTYLLKALEVDEKTNSVVQFLPESLTQAQALEKVNASNRGLLHGVPVSIKENFDIQGCYSTCGLICGVENLAAEDCVIAKVLRHQGAVIFAKTNVPQSLLSFECSNPIFGQTSHPMDATRSPGGSSGGEGALIGGGGSILGIGSDIGGSIRIPASFCGICGLKPTGGRLSNKGGQSSISGQKGVIPSAGPIARDVDGLALCMEALLCPKLFALDPTVPPLPFDRKIYENKSPMVVGYYEGDGFIQPNPSMRRSVREARALLENNGHKLVPFEPPRLEYCLTELVMKALFADGAETLLGKFAGDVVDPNLHYQISMYRIPKLLSWLLSVLTKPFAPRQSKALRMQGGVKNVAALWKLHAAIEAYRTEFISAWRVAGIEVLLCPALGPALKIGHGGKLSALTVFHILYNLLNFPAGVVPMGTVTVQDEQELSDYRGHYGDIWEKAFPKAVAGGVGLPLSVQCVALPWQEEQCLRLMREVENAARS
ncbi:fatty-acid amide hydrolase 1 isoform X1 [Petromyzon marinus]|uniref:fatty-acid amide hydrolase 1 isoform X1 n=1 Tax=Petromyzon marinus TaxID=7757 RepID=UPI003F6F60DC